MFDRTLDHALAAEASGFESVWVMDHFWQLPPLGGPDEPILEAYTLLGALAARTERVQLGTLVTGVTYRNPALLAKMVTTLDVISHGRAILGIGAAWYDSSTRATASSSRRRANGSTGSRRRCRSAARCCATNARRSPASTTPTKDARNVPAPLQSGGVPIMIGGSGEKRTLKLVAQYADMCNVSGGPRPSATSSTCCARTATPSGATRRRSRRPGWARCARRRRRRGGADARVPHAAWPATQFDEQFTVGTADEVVQARSSELVATGIDCLIFNMPLSDPDTVARAGELLTSNFA